MSGLVAILLSLCAAAPAASIASLPPAVPPAVPAASTSSGSDESRRALFALAFPDGEAPFDLDGPGSEQAFLASLATPLFLHEVVGPFDLYVMRADGLGEGREAEQLLSRAAAGLEPLVPVMERHFSGEAGLIAGRRLPLVLTRAERSAGERSFDQVVALLEWAEDDYSGWKQTGNPIWTGELLGGLNVRTWEVQVFNLAHEFAAGHGKAFLDHGLGYYTLAHVAARVLRQGSWGMVPPWLGRPGRLEARASGLVSARVVGLRARGRLAPAARVRSSQGPGRHRLQDGRQLAAPFLQR
jgi:hypothetical protein